MFDIGFWELLLIGLMALVVLGPERLPVAIRTVRNWISNARRISENVKSELTEELRIHELHSNLKKAEQANMQNLSPEVAESLKTLKEAAEMVNEPYKVSEPNQIKTSDKALNSQPTTTKVKDAQLVDAQLVSPQITDSKEKNKESDVNVTELADKKTNQ